MQKTYKDYFIAALVFLGIIFIIFYLFFLKGLYPFPGNYMLAWYQPWKTDHSKGQTITIQHKPIADDTFRYLYPFKKLGIDIAKKGKLPLWNPYNGAGMPLLATYQWAFFNPFNILFFALQTETAWTFYIIAQVFLLYFFMYLYCRKLRMSQKGAIFATSIFTFSGFVTVRLIFGNLIYPLTMLPFILYLIEDYIDNQKSKKIFLLPLATSFMLLSGHPHTMFYTLIVSMAYLIYRILTLKKSNFRKVTAFLLLIILFVIGIGIASIQIVPTLELLKSSNMNASSSAFIFDRFLLPISHLISILIPNYFGNRATYNYWGAGDYIETVAAVGIIPLFFAYFALFGKNYSSKDNRIFFFIASIISILATLNWFLPKLISILPIPIISTSPPSRIFAITSFAIAILAGYGFDRWTLYMENFRRLLIRVIPFLIIIFIIAIGTFLFYILGISCNNQFIQNCRLIAARNTLLETFTFVVSLGFFFFYLKTKNKKIKKYVPFVVISLVFLLGAYNSNKFLPFSQKENLLPAHPLIEAIKRVTNTERVFGLGEANIKTNFATHFRFYDLNYFDPLHNKRYAELIAFANSETIANLSRSDIEITTDLNISKEKQLRRDRLLNLLGVSYFIVKKSEIPLIESKDVAWQNKDWYLLGNKKSLPRVYLVNNLEVISNQNLILERLFDTSFDPKTTVILEEPTSSPLNNASKGKAQILRYEENSVEVKAQSDYNSVLVLSDNYFPGWKVYIDEKETKIYRANYTFRAIEVPEGKHLVKFSYEPGSFKTGTILSIISIGIYLLIIFYIKNKHKS